MLDTKIAKTIIQFYQEKRLLHIAGGDYEKEAMEFDPALVDGFSFDLIVTPGTNSPTYKMAIEDTLYKLLEAQAINLEIYLENTSLPFKDKILDSIRRNAQALQNGQQMPGVDPSLMAQVEAASNPQAMQLINQGMS